ncbi:MAG: putative integral rane protein [Devosia sp.]|uniref:DUF2269 family protein n=1 Tax=Devosia sp. TaxID=1871048 RepID=UPI0026081E53|nr:DUF2269 family protein [Devosia sp.]MDB5541375.1 putative integral rane protein [Devosia sp.]
MDLYTIFKFLHVAAAMAWIGGGVTLFAMGMFAASRKDEAEMMHVLGSVGFMANRWFVPASLATLVFGIAMATLGGLWGQAWVVLGLLGFAATFCTGHFVLRIKAMEAGALMGEDRVSEAAAVGRKLMQVAKFDYAMLFTVVALMVFKPAWTDFVTLGLAAAVLLAAGWFFLAGGLRRDETVPA